jgi:6-phosphogluconolactonase (cycloisomerase 2 family)
MLHQGVLLMITPDPHPHHFPKEIAQLLTCTVENLAAALDISMRAAALKYGWAMKDKRIFAIVLVSILLTFLAGCGGISASGAIQPTPTPVSPNPSPTPTPSANASSFIYGITVFEPETGYQGASINGATGQLTPAASFNNSGLGQNIVTQVIADPTGRFLYSLNLGTANGGVTDNNPGIAELQIDRQTGALSRIAGSPLVFTSFHGSYLAIEPSGHFLYQANAGVFDIYAIDQSSGLLTKMPSSTAASQGDFIAISPDGRFLFNAGDTSVEALSLDASGNLSVVQAPVPTGGTANEGQLLVSSDNQFLYVLNQGNVAIFNISASGMLTPVAGSPFSTDPRANSISLTPDGKHLYVTFQGATTYATGFTFDPLASTLTPIQNGTINNAWTVTVDASGRLAYISNSLDKTLQTYSIDSATGALTMISQTTQPTSQNSRSMATVP